MQNPLSLQGLISWLEKQPADGTYDYTDPTNCLCFKYLKSLGLPVHSVNDRRWTEEGYAWWIEAGKRHALPPFFDEIAATPNFNGPRTYGLALARARKIQAKLEN